MYNWSAYLPPYPGRRVSYVDGAGHWCGESPEDTHPVLYLSASMGTLAIETTMVHSAGLNTRCLSYGYAETKAVNLAMHLGNAYGSRLFLDSGAFTLQKQKASESQIKTYMEKYARFLRETHGWWDWYASVDYKRDSRIIRHAQTEMHKLGARPTPVYHGDSSIDWFDRYCQDGYKLVAIGRPPKHIKMDLDYYYGRVFDHAAKYGVRLHGLQETGKRMFKYPWWSVDSSSWLFGSSQGMVFYFDPKAKQFSHVYVVEGKYDPSTRNWKTCAPEFRRNILDFAAKFRITEEMLLTRYAVRNLFNAAVMAYAVKAGAGRFDNSNQAWKAVL